MRRNLCLGWPIFPICAIIYLKRLIQSQPCLTAIKERDFAKMINILTDSSCDLGNDLILQYQIGVIPLYVIHNDKTYRDGIDLDLRQLFDLVDKSGQLPKTSAASVAEFIAFFNRPGENIYIGLGSPISVTYSNALMASETMETKNTRVIDSLNLSTGIGLLLLKAADLRDQGCSAGEIALAVQACVPKVHTTFVLDRLDYVYMGGRVSSIQMIVGSMLKIQPVVAVRQDGTLGIREKVRGSRKKALDCLLADFQAHLPELDPKRVFVTHTLCDSDAQYLVSELKKMAPIENIYITLASSIIAAHAGPGTIGILYMTH
jgi:DegV family protein with EDD domain